MTKQIGFTKDTYIPFFNTQWQKSSFEQLLWVDISISIHDKNLRVLVIETYKLSRDLKKYPECDITSKTSKPI